MRSGIPAEISRKIWEQGGGREGGQDCAPHNRGNDAEIEHGARYLVSEYCGNGRPIRFLSHQTRSEREGEG